MWSADNDAVDEQNELNISLPWPWILYVDDNGVSSYFNQETATSWIVSHDEAGNRTFYNDESGESTPHQPF